MRLGLINLDMMDLKTIVGHSGGSTLMVGQVTQMMLLDFLRMLLVPHLQICLWTELRLVYSKLREDRA